MDASALVVAARSQGARPARQKTVWRLPAESEEPVPEETPSIHELQLSDSKREEWGAGEVEIYDLWYESNPMNSTTYIVTTLLFNETGRIDNQPVNACLMSMCGMLGYGDAIVYVHVMDKEQVTERENMSNPLMSAAGETVSSLRYKLNYLKQVKLIYQSRISPSWLENSLAPLRASKDLIRAAGIAMGIVELDPLWRTVKWRSRADALGFLAFAPGVNKEQSTRTLRRLISGFIDQTHEQVEEHARAYREAYAQTVWQRESGSGARQRGAAQRGRARRRGRGRDRGGRMLAAADGVQESDEAPAEPESEPASAELQECFICFEMRPDVARFGVNCEHTFCRQCQQNWAAAAARHRTGASCPFCRRARE